MLSRWPVRITLKAEVEMSQVRGVAVRMLATALRCSMRGRRRHKALVTEGQGIGVSEEKSGLEGVNDQGFECLAEEHVVVQTKGSGRKGADDCAEVLTRRGCLRQESRDEPSEAGPGA